MMIGEAYRKGIELLKIAGNEAPAQEAGALLCSVAHCGRTFLYAHGTDEFDDVLYGHYFTLLERRAEGVPLQYLTGMQEFMSLPFEVGPGVLVPRQETELLAETVINRCKGRSGSEDVHSKADSGRYDISILDVGTGSGCIAVSLAYYVPGCLVTAIDRMPEAISIAQRNAVLNKVANRIHFIESNLFEAISAERFDIIVSNPPYIRTGDIKGLQKEVRCYEPMEALDGGSDGLDFYRAIIEKAPGFLYEGGMLAFETGYDQAQDVAEIMSGSFGNIQIYKDLAGIDRVVAGNCINENIFWFSAY